MHAKHPDEEARRRCDERGLPTIDTDADGDDRDRGSDEGGDGVKPGAQHGRDLADQYVAQRPATHPCDGADAGSVGVAFRLGLPGVQPG